MLGINMINIFTPQTMIDYFVLLRFRQIKVDFTFFLSISQYFFMIALLT